MKQPTQQQKDDLLRTRLNQETARIPWSELERHFAAGNVVWIAPGLDLIEIGVLLANDDKDTLAPLIEQGKVARVSDAQAGAWSATGNTLWSVVIAPFVLVQESKTAH
ncbi:MAG TPA: DUF2288 domain-containing protein [Burkholderiaceae bacterium]